MPSSFRQTPLQFFFDRRAPVAVGPVEPPGPDARTGKVQQAIALSLHFCGAHIKSFKVGELHRVGHESGDLKWHFRMHVVEKAALVGLLDLGPGLSESLALIQEGRQNHVVFIEVHIHGSGRGTAPDLPSQAWWCHDIARSDAVCFAGGSARRLMKPQRPPKRLRKIGAG
jgi:hypothetical protein